MTHIPLFRLMISVGSALLFMFGNPAPGVAQITPADSAAVLMEAAADFEARGRSEIAAAIYRLVVRRYANLPVAAVASEHLSEVSLVRSASGGRTELQVWSTIYGLWLGGVAIPGFFEAERSEAIGAGLLVGGPLGFLVGRGIARSRPLSVGQARAITWGGTWGSFQGLGWALVLDLGSEELCSDFGCSRSDETARAVFGSMILGGVSGLVVGNVLSHRDISDGLATTVGLGSLWGAWFGAAGGILADLEGDGLLAATLIGGNAGLVSMAVAGDRWTPTRSRVRIVSIAGVVGGLGGAGLDLIIQPDNEKIAIAIPLATSIAGLFIGAAVTRDRRETVKGPADESFAGGALLNMNGGQFRVGLPFPGVARFPVRGVPSPGLSVTVPLLRFRF